jgi:hypothetical protein
MFENLKNKKLGYENMTENNQKIKNLEKINQLSILGNSTNKSNISSLKLGNLRIMLVFPAIIM